MAEFGSVENCRRVIAETDRHFGCVDVLVAALDFPIRPECQPLKAHTLGAPQDHPAANCLR